MTRQIPGLGEITAKLYDDFPHVEQYRGIPYASVPARWRQSKLVTSWPDGKWDGTKYGPICPFPKMVIGTSITQKNLPLEHDYVMDEFKCLNLNITCPKGAKPESGYPVAVWVHGGGNVVGLGSSSEYNGAPLVDFSVKQGKPIIVVTINYRLGGFGFMASEDILNDNASVSDGGCGNYGVRDQLVAYDWVKKNIKAFGGDDARITGIGESAGSMDTHAIMCSELFATALPFSQAILQSGVAPLTVRSLKQQQVIYNKFLAYHKIHADISQERLRALRDTSTDEFMESYIALGAPVVAWYITIDNYFLKSSPTVQGLRLQKYNPSIKRLLIGDCAHEGTIFTAPVSKMDWTFEKLSSMVSTYLGEERYREFFKAYNITPDMSLEKFKQSLTAISSDIEWSQPIEAAAKSFPNGQAFYYHIVEGNPFDGPLKGLAGHGSDLIYIFLTYQKELPEHLQKFAEKMANYWLTFINGEMPWTPYGLKSTGDSLLMRFGPNGHCEEVAEKTKFSYQNLRMIENWQPIIGKIGAALRGEPLE